MSSAKFIVFRGKQSQTGLAFQKEFVGVDFPETEYSFDEIEGMMNSPLKVVIPIWNSHEGEIIVSYAMKMIFEKNARLYYLWPKEIEFQCLIKPENYEKQNVMSVSVAETQCSDFIKSKNLSFVKVADTKTAYDKFKNDTKNQYYSVLTAPELNPDGFDVLCGKAENKLNFTTFSILGSSHSELWDEKDWGELSNKIYPAKRIFVGVEMPLDDNFSEAQQELFNMLIEDADSISEIPKALFVSSNNGSDCRILFESSDEFAPSEMLNEYGNDDSIKIIPNAGITAIGYSERAMDFLTNKDEFPKVDFVKHQGTKTCFFACPALGIMTHGFDIYTTELIVLKMIDKCFELLSRLDVGDILSPEEELYNKYKEQYLKNSTDCISFSSLS